MEENNEINNEMRKSLIILLSFQRWLICSKIKVKKFFHIKKKQLYD